MALTPSPSWAGRCITWTSNGRAWRATCEDGNHPIDNNPAENAIRPFVIGRKNWLFSATPRGADASANLYSLIETARVNGVEPQAYLTRVFTEFPNATTLDEIEALLPWTLAVDPGR